MRYEYFTIFPLRSAFLFSVSLKKQVFSVLRNTHPKRTSHSHNMPEAAIKTSKMSNEMQEFAISTANDAIKNQWNEQVQHITTRENPSRRTHTHIHTHTTGNSIEYQTGI